MQKIQNKISQKKYKQKRGSHSSSKQFWNFVKPFLTNKGCMSNDFIRNGDVLIDKESKSVEMFNSHYINLVEKTFGVPPENYVLDGIIIEGIIENMRDNQVY